MWNSADTGDTASTTYVNKTTAIQIKSIVRNTHGSAMSRSVSLMIRFGNAMLRI